MQKRNSTHEFPKDEKQKEVGANSVCPKNDVRVRLEVEVTESLYAAISREKSDSTKRGRVVEVTIIRPGKRGTPSIKPTEEESKNDGKLNPEKFFERSSGSATERRDVQRLGKRQHKSFVTENPVPSSLAIKAEKILDDSPSVMRLKPRIIKPEMDPIYTTPKISHGDYCDPAVFNPKISHTKIGRNKDAAELLRAYVDSPNKSEKNESGMQPCVNPFVYQLRMEKENRRTSPLVEVSAAQKILETYSSGSNCSHENLDVIKKILTEWDSDEKRIAEMLLNDSSTLRKCEHCGVISFKNRERIPVNVEKWKRNTCNIDNLGTSDRMLQEESRVNSQDFEKRELDRENLVTKLFSEGSVDTKEMSSDLMRDTMVAERESDSVSENKKSTNVGQKKVLKSCLPLLIPNRCRQCSSLQEKNEMLNDARLRSTYSTRYSPRQIVSKNPKKPVRNTSGDNWNRSSFRSESNKGKSSLIKSRKDSKIATPVQDAVNNKLSQLKNSSQRKKCPTFPIAPPNIPIQREKSFSVVEKERKSLEMDVQSKDERNLVSAKNNESEFPSDHNLCRPLESQTLLKGGLLKGRQINVGQSDSLRKNNPLSDEKFTMDQKYKALNNAKQISYSNNERRLLDGSKNRKPNQIDVSVISDYNYSVPSIGSPQKISVVGKRDFVTVARYSPEINSPAEFTGESETTAFSSSSSENAIREWDKSVMHDSMVDLTDDRSTPRSAVRIGRAEIERPIKKCGRAIFDSEKKFCSSKTPAISKPETKVFDKSWSKSTLKMTYKNSSSVISSSSEYSGVDRREPNVGETGSILELNESEKFERQIKYEEISPREMSAESKANLESSALSVYRKILESKDEMDWETFQQLVETLHPSQRELWCDICKAVSNEAKRVAGETGASTEVCIEINPVPTSHALSCERRSVINTSENEVSFEIDMVLDDFENFFDHKSSTDTKTSCGLKNKFE